MLIRRVGLLLLIIINLPNSITAQDSTAIKIHFLYGSKPAKEYKDVEQKWFGGMYGGHAGIEIDSNQILNFLP
jgi:hypothetical protein